MFARNASLYYDSLIRSNEAASEGKCCDWVEIMSHRAARAVAWRRKQRTKRRLQRGRDTAEF